MERKRTLSALEGSWIFYKKQIETKLSVVATGPASQAVAAVGRGGCRVCCGSRTLEMEGGGGDGGKRHVQRQVLLDTTAPLVRVS